MFKKKSYKKLSLGLSLALIISNLSGLGNLTFAKAEEGIAEDLFISEYIEGSSNNKAIEIFNGTGKTVKLADYKIRKHTNGANKADAPLELAVTSDTSLENGKVYVISNTSSALPELKLKIDGGKADIQDGSKALSYNGNDALELVKVINGQDVVIDIVGNYGNGASDKNYPDFATDVTLVRKSTINKGNTIYNADEWNKLPKDTISDIGSHKMDGAVTVLIKALTLPEKADVDAGKTIKLTPVYEPENTTQKNIEWTSSDETIATVGQDGTVTGVKAGQVTVTAVSKDNPEVKAATLINIIPAAPATQISIADARTKTAGSEVEVEGIVTFVDAGSDKSPYNTYIQDATAGIDIVYSKAFGIALNSGDRIRVKGKTKTFNGLLEIEVTATSNITAVSSKNALPVPKEITIAKANSDEFESQRVLIKNVVIGNINTTGNTEITDTAGNKTNIYKIPALTGIAAGDTVDVIAVVSEYTRSGQAVSYQLRVVKPEDVTKSAVQQDTIKPVITHTAITEANIASDLEIKAVITDNNSVSSAKVYYRAKGESSYKTAAMKLSNNEYVAVIPKEDLKIAGLEYYIEATDGNNTATAPEDSTKPYAVTATDKDINGPEITKVEPSDDAVLDITNTRPSIKAEFKDNSGIDDKSVKLFLDGSDVTSDSVLTSDSVSYAVKNALSEGMHTAKLEISDRLGNETDKQWSFRIGKEQFNLYYGQLHSHTNLSDGTGTPDEAYAWARDNANADYVAVTDHSNWFDNEKDLTNETITDVSQSTSTEWKQLHETADKYTKDGEFVAIAGFEMTWSGSTGGWGHINTFNTPWFTSRSNSKMDLKAYYNKLAQPENKDSISQLNHPGKTFGDFADFGFYSQGADNVTNLIEVGNGEGLIRTNGYFPSFEYYTRALDKGWHLAPTNNQDNHKGKWVNANTTRTVILADKLTEDSLYEAMRNRRVYATEDENLRISYTVNDKPMGTILGNPSELKAKISITDPDSTDKIGKVSIIVDGGYAAVSKTFDSNTAEWNLDLPAGYKYYYVRVDQGDKDIAVTAPVWAGSVVPVGISKVEVSQDPQVVNNPVNITANVYNNGTEALSNVKVNFYEGSIAPENKIGDNTITDIKASSSGNASISWTPKNTGEIKIYAASTINIDGKDNVFTQTCSFIVSKPEDLVKVVIDGGHQNQYVSGDYAGKMTTLAETLKNKKYMLVQNQDELTAADLENAKILILTDPQSKDTDTLKKSIYTDAEVKVIQDFIKNGGNLIITSRADYNDAITTKENNVTKIIGEVPAEYENATQGNRVLEAIGSNLRFNDDEVIDKTSNGGQEYRLYFDKYTSSKYGLTENIVEGETYSAYSGCSIILKDNGNSSNIDWLVKGHDTTESLDSDLQNDAVAVAKGNVNSLAAEILENGSKIIVAGTTFFSDFETQSGDNAYSNKTITDNVINWMSARKPAELRTIADVRADADNDGVPDNIGKRFAVEGVVTSQSEAVTPKNAFFEVIYVQDATGGITVFGVSKTELKIGQKVRVTGIVDQYGGDSELQIEDETRDVQILDTSIVKVEPRVISTNNSMKDTFEGWLVKIQGKVTKIDKNNIYVNDGSGEARAYIEGYINDGSGDTSKNGKWDSSIKVGDTVSIIGLASEDPEGHRIRVRNTSEIVKEGNAEGSNGGTTTPGNTNNPDTGKDNKNSLEVIRDLISNTKPGEKIKVNAQSNPVIDAKVFAELKGVDRVISFTVESQGMKLIWTFNGKDIKDTNTSIDLTLNESAPNRDIISKIDSNAQILSFKNHGELPAPMTVTIPVDTSKFDVSKPLYFYYYNETTKKAELVGDALKAYKVGDAYFVDVTITHNSDFFLSAKDSNTVKTQIDKLVQTGSPVDLNSLVGIGLIFVLIGVLLVVKRRRFQ